MNVDTGGLRNEVPLTIQQVLAVEEYAQILGLNSAKIVHLDWMHTAYSSEFDELVIGTDVMPSPSPSTANSGISMKATLAHEIVGHRDAALRGWTQPKDYILPGFTLEEVQASIRGARFAPDLSFHERVQLLKDAIERLQNRIHIRTVTNKLHITER